MYFEFFSDLTTQIDRNPNKSEQSLKNPKNYKFTLGSCIFSYFWEINYKFKNIFINRISICVLRIQLEALPYRTLLALKKI